VCENKNMIATVAIIILKLIIIIIIIIICNRRAKILLQIRYFQAPEGRRADIVLHNLKEKKESGYL
jgi:hypothetical protein